MQVFFAGPLLFPSVDGAPKMSAEFPKPSELSPSAPSGSNNDVWNDEQREVHRQRLGNQDDLNSPDMASPNGFWGDKQVILKKVGILAVLGTWVFFNFYKFDYVVVLPGGTDVVNERITIKATAAGAGAGGTANTPAGAAPKTYPAQGKLMWATVGVKNDVRGLDLLMGWLKGDSDVFKRELLYGKANPKEAAQQSRDEMDDAKSVAKVLAARRLGIATFEGGAEVLDREKGRPVEKLLANGELIVAADGKSICLSGDLRELMLTKKRGDTVSLTVQSVPKPGTTATGAAKAGAAGVTGTPAPKPVERTVVVPLHEVKGIKRQLMGVILGPSKTRPCRLPFELEVNTDRIGGPSAGLAMTLAVLDRLSPGELTGGGKVAATGTIEADGSVGQVGGVKQKTASVRASGAKLFLVPIEEVALAKPHAGKMQVVGVRNLDEALAALRKAGGDPLPSPSR